ncbi:MAG: hypothetical protein ACTS27_00850 [Phycisphaerales bacterium]
MNWTNPNLLIFLIFVILPALQWIAQKIKERREAAQAEERIRRRQEETLRTGREPEEDRQAATARAQARARLEEQQREAMRKRQEQLRELRRKQMQAQAEARARARQNQPTRPRPTPTARPRPTPQAQQQQPARPAPARQTPDTARANRYSQPSPPPQRSRQSQPARPSSGSGTRPGELRPSEFERITRQRQIEAAKRQAFLQAQSEEADRRGEDALRPMLAHLSAKPDVSAPDATEATTSGADLLTDLNPDDWRRGMVLAEVLGKPVALREERDGVWI